MLDPISNDAMYDILKPYSWDSNPIPPDGYQDHGAAGSREDAIQDIAAQIGLTCALTDCSGMAHVIVPKHASGAAVNHIAHFFQFIHLLGERNGCELYQVSRIRDTAHDLYENAVERGQVHPLFSVSWRKGLKPVLWGSAYRENPDLYFEYRSDGDGVEIGEDDALWKYRLSLPKQEYIPFPVRLTESEIQACGFFDRCVRHGYRVFFCGRPDTANGFVSDSAAIAGV